MVLEVMLGNLQAVKIASFNKPNGTNSSAADSRGGLIVPLHAVIQIKIVRGVIIVSTQEKCKLVGKLRFSVTRSFVHYLKTLTTDRMRHQIMFRVFQSGE